MKILKWLAIFAAIPAIALALHAGVVLLVDSHGWVRLSPADWAAWVGAVGTVGALFVAVGIWRRDHEIRREDAYTQAMIAAADKFALVHTTLTELHAARNMVEGAPHTPDLRKYLVDGRNRVAAVKHWSSEEIAKLAPLPNNCARRIARAQFNMTMFLNFGLSDMYLMSVPQSTREQQLEFCRLKALDIMSIIDDLTKAANVLGTAGSTLNKPGELTIAMAMERREQERLAGGTDSGWRARFVISPFKKLRQKFTPLSG